MRRSLSVRARGIRTADAHSHFDVPDRAARLGVDRRETILVSCTRCSGVALPTAQLGLQARNESTHAVLAVLPSWSVALRLAEADVAGEPLLPADFVGRRRLDRRGARGPRPRGSPPAGGA